MKFDRWMERLGAALAVDTPTESASDDLERVSALLLVEIARSDHEIDDSERAAIRAALRQSSGLDATELDALVDEAMGDADAALSLHAHVQRLNESLDKGGKIRLVEQMWRVAYADGDLDRYEEYTIRKLADLLYLKHRDFMQAKLRVLDGGAARDDDGPGAGAVPGDA